MCIKMRWTRYFRGEREAGGKGVVISGKEMLTKLQGRESGALFPTHFTNGTANVSTRATVASIEELILQAVEPAT